MKPQIACFSCFVQQVQIATNLAAQKNSLKLKVLRRVLPYLARIDFKQSPPQIASQLFNLVYQITNCRDPYYQKKIQYNKIVRKMLPRLGKIVANSRNKLFTAAKLALAGNIIDFGILTNFDLDKTIKNTLSQALARNHWRFLEKKLYQSQTLFYIADNAGEIGFDKIFLEEIKKINPTIKIVMAVKEIPIINDATREDALYFGLDKLAKIITNGNGLVGTHLANCSPEFIEYFWHSEVVISKGQANYESLDTVKNQKLFFLLKAKCPVVAASLRVNPVRSPYSSGVIMSRELIG